MNKKGFTLTEIIAVVVIVGIVIIIAIPASRQLIANNEKERIENKQKAVEKAMITYAETDNRKMNCVNMTIKDLVDNGYIKESDLGEKYSNINKTWYYYNGNIQEIAPSGVTCAVALSHDINDEIDEEYEEVVAVPEHVEVNDYTLNVSLVSNTYNIVSSTKITMKAGTLSTECNDASTCTLEGVPRGTSVTYSVNRDYYNSSSGTISAATSDGVQTKSVSLSAKVQTYTITNKYLFPNDTTHSLSYSGRIVKVVYKHDLLLCATGIFGCLKCYSGTVKTTMYGANTSEKFNKSYKGSCKNPNHQNDTVPQTTYNFTFSDNYTGVSFYSSVWSSTLNGSVTVLLK